MSLNPFRKVTLHCSVSANVARDRLRQITELETPWTLTTRPVLQLGRSGRRYMGVIKGNSFRLFIRPYIPFSHAGNFVNLFYSRNFTYLRDTCLAIRGTIEPTSNGCTINLLFKPKGLYFVILPVWLAGLILIMINLVVKDGLQFHDAVPLVFIGVGLFMMRAFYLSSYALEKDFLEGLFTADANLTDSAAPEHSVGQYGL